MEPVPFLCCRNLSRIVPLYGLDVSVRKTEFIINVPHLYSHAASNETYSAKRDKF
jgi:hypothetical protein